MGRTDQINDALDALGDDPVAADIAYATRGYDKRDVTAALAERALTGGRAVGAVANPVSEVAWNIVASEAQPIPLFITGPPVGTEDEYLAAIVTGDPDYALVFLISTTGGLTLSPTDPADPALTLNSLAEDDSLVFRVKSALGDVFTVAADGTVAFNQPGVKPVLNIDSEGQPTLSGLEKPVIPAIPNVQDVADVLVALNLADQEA